jgi:GH15 family glucan-1,4-alpha-glucosidase
MRAIMALPIEGYALIGHCKTAALVGRDDSIDWLCWPRFDSAACFAALLSTADNGRWLMASKDPPISVRRRYRLGTLILETEFQTEAGSAVVIDFIPPADGAHLVRIVTGRSGRAVFLAELMVRFNYGVTVPWVNRLDDGSIDAIAGRGPPPPIDTFNALERTEAFWRQWSDRCPQVGPWTEVVKRSLITLKALTYARTGGIIAAATTSFPQRLGGVRNWD